MSKLLLRPKKVYVAPRKRWDVNEIWGSISWNGLAANSFRNDAKVILANARRETLDTSLPINTSAAKLRVKHIELDVKVPILEPGMMCVVYIMSLPDNYTFTSVDQANTGISGHSLPSTFPERVMGCKAVTPNEGGGNLSVRVTSGKLQKILSTGEAIFFVPLVINASATNTGARKFRCPKALLCRRLRVRKSGPLFLPLMKHKHCLDENPQGSFSNP